MSDCLSILIAFSNVYATRRRHRRCSRRGCQQRNTMQMFTLTNKWNTNVELNFETIWPFGSVVVTRQQPGQQTTKVVTCLRPSDWNFILIGEDKSPSFLSCRRSYWMSSVKLYLVNKKGVFFLLFLVATFFDLCTSVHKKTWRVDEQLLPSKIRGGECHLFNCCTTPCYQSVSVRVEGERTGEVNT